MTAGGFHTCIKTSENNPYCWGKELEQQDGEDDYTRVPEDKKDVEIKTISAGYRHTCFIDSNHRPYCWGNNAYGQARIPADIGKVKDIAAGGKHTSVLTAQNNKVECWGWSNVDDTPFDVDEPSIGMWKRRSQVGRNSAFD